MVKRPTLMDELRRALDSAMDGLSQPLRWTLNETCERRLRRELGANIYFMGSPPAIHGLPYKVILDQSEPWVLVF